MAFIRPRIPTAEETVREAVKWWFESTRGHMQKSTNMEKQVCWGWDGVYDYHDMRQYYKRFLEEEIGEALEELEWPRIPTAEEAGLEPVQWEFESPRG